MAHNPNPFQIGNRKVGLDFPSLVLAEIGINIQKAGFKNIYPLMNQDDIAGAQMD